MGGRDGRRRTACGLAAGALIENVGQLRGGFASYPYGGGTVAVENVMSNEVSSRFCRMNRTEWFGVVLAVATLLLVAAYFRS